MRDRQHSRSAFLLAASMLGLLAAVRPGAAQGVFDMGMLGNTLSQGGAAPQQQPAAPLRKSQFQPPAPTQAPAQPTPAQPAPAQPAPQAQTQPPAPTQPANPFASAFGGAAPLQAAPAPARPAAPAGFQYAVSPALKQQAQAEFLDRLRQTNPATVPAVQQALAQNDYAQIWTDLVGTYGLKPDDAADAMAAYMILGWMIVNQGGEPSQTAVTRARDQVAGILSRDPRIAVAETRGKLGEEFKLLLVMLHAGWQAAMREGTLPQYATGVATMFRQQSQIDMAGLVLDDSGFKKKG